VLVLSFIESFATILLERAIYFYSHERLGYSRAQNLGLALVFGVTYASGAAASHPLARRLGDRRALIASVLVLLLLHLLIAAAPGGVLLPIGFAAVGFFEGTKWPVVESYVGAGLEPGQQVGAVGRFNVTWALAVPLALAASGPLIASGEPTLLFLSAAVANVLALGLCATLPAAAPHLESTHPGSSGGAESARYGALLVASRWTMLSSYTLMFLLAPLLPEVFQRLGRPVAEATLWASSMDAVRVLTFATLALVSGWRGRIAPLLVGALGMPAGFAIIMSGYSLGVVILGEVVFGVFVGVIYHLALYYALVVKNAGVDAGGGHEGLIGLGLALGPAVGLLGEYLAGEGSSPLAFVLLAAAPLVFSSMFASLRWLARARAIGRVNAGLS
jgi:MFS family permease